MLDILPTPPNPGHIKVSTRPWADPALVFAETDRGPSDNLRLAFEATTRLDPDEQAMVRTLIEAILLKHEAKRWAS